MTAARAVPMAATCVDESVDKDPIKPILLLMAVCMRLAVAPALADDARAPWHPAQLEAYKVAPSVTGVGVGGGVGAGVTAARAVPMAATCVDESADNDPMEPILLLIAVCIRLAVAPALADDARAPWHPAQLEAYKVAPSVTGVGVGVGVGAGVTAARAVPMAATWVAESADNDPMEPVLLLMAVCIRAAVAPALLELAKAPWHEAQ